MTKKAILLRSVSTIATAAASTALGMHGAQAQVVPAGTDGYYYSVTGGFALSKSEQFLTGLQDKVGQSSGSSRNSSYSNSGNSSSSGYSTTSSYGSSYNSGLDGFTGMFASVSLGKQMGDFDVRGSLSMTGAASTGYAEATVRNSSYNYYSSSSASESGSSHNSAGEAIRADGKNSQSILAADFEVGYTPTLGNNLNVRLFAGLRALQFSQKFEGNLSGSSFSSSSFRDTNNPGTSSGSSYDRSTYTFSGLSDSTFTAVGPRVGVQGSTRFEGSNFGISGSLATSVLVGKQTVKTSGYGSSSSYSESSYSANPGNSSNSHYSGSSGYLVNETGSGNKTVLDLQASAGVDYYLNDNSVLTIGYQAENLMEIAGDDLGPNTNIDSLTHGAFVKLSGSF